MTCSPNPEDDNAHVPLAWRTYAEPSDVLSLAMVLMSELWIERCTVGIVRGQLEHCPRYFLSNEQEHRITTLRAAMVACIPFGAPVRRPGDPRGSAGMFVQYSKTAGGMWSEFCA